MKTESYQSATIETTNHSDPLILSFLAATKKMTDYSRELVDDKAAWPAIRFVDDKIGKIRLQMGRGDHNTGEVFELVEMVGNVKQYLFTGNQTFLNFATVNKVSSS